MIFQASVLLLFWGKRVDAYLNLLWVDVVFELLKDPRNMLSPVVGLKGSDDALVERLADGCDVWRQEKYEDIIILETTKAAIIGNLVDFVVRHCVATKIIHKQQNISIVSSSNTIYKLLNYLHEDLLMP